MRVSPFSFGLSALTLLGPLACGPAQPPVDTAPQPSASAAPPPATVAAPAYDLSPVAEPADMVGLVRWKTPSTTISTVGGCANLPQELVKGVPIGILGKALDEVLHGDVDGKKLAAVVAMDVSVDLVVALDPTARRGEPMFAFSLGLTSLDAAKEAISSSKGPPAEIVPGVFRIGDKEERRDLSCVVAVSTGPTPARLICGRRDKWVTALVPYMTRTLPTAPPAATDIHAEARYAPVDARYGEMLRGYATGLPVIAKSQLSIGDQAFEAALNDAATGLSDEAVALTRDLDKLTVDLSTDPAKCLTASVALQLRDKSSWLAGTMLDRPERAGPPPALFWRAPKDSDSVSFGRATDPARFAAMIKTVRTMLDSALGKFQIGSGDDRKALADLIAMPLNKEANTVSASGHSPLPAAPAKAKGAAKPSASPSQEPPRPTAQQTADNVVSGIGWTLVGFEQSSAAIGKWLKDVVAVYGRNGLVDPLKKAVGKNDAAKFPSIKVVGAPASLGKDAFDVEIKVAFSVDAPKSWEPPRAVEAPGGGKGKKPPPPAKPPPPKQEKVAFTLHLLLMPDGNNTWVAFGANKDELVKHLLMVKTGAPDSETITARAGLESLRSSKNMSGGFWTLSSFHKLLQWGANRRGFDDMDDRSDPFKDTPHKGSTPIFYATTVTPGNGPKGDLTIKLSKESVEDIVALVTTQRTRSASIAVDTPAAAPPPPPPPGKR